MTARNGWTLQATADFQALLNRLLTELKAAKAADPEGWEASARAKVTARVLDTILVEIPEDPAAKKFRQGKTLGGAYKHWRRAKFLARYRLFYRYDAGVKIIIYAWLNDEDSLRKAGSKTDPYAIFAKRLASGKPPTSWEDLVKAASALTLTGEAKTKPPA